MPLATGPNLELDNTWALVADGVSELLITLIEEEPVVIALGQAAPSAGLRDGHRLYDAAGRDAFPMGGLAGTKVYARALQTGRTSVIAVTRG